MGQQLAGTWPGRVFNGWGFSYPTPTQAAALQQHRLGGSELPSLGPPPAHVAPPSCWMEPLAVLFLFVCLFVLINLFIYGCVGSSFLCEGFLQLRQAGATLHRGARASHCRGLSCCGAQAPDAQAQ